MENLEEIGHNLNSLRSKIKEIFESIPKEKRTKCPELIAVSKLKSKYHIIEAYKHGQRDFGENYIQELCEKANDSEILEQCPSIKWHLIGHIQSNKINKLHSIKNLHLIQTIDSLKLAENLNASINRNSTKPNDDKINVLVQVNTSGEKEKSGINPDDADALVQFITDKCNRLKFSGLMTIGAYDFDTSQGLNPDFLKLIEIRDRISNSMKIPMNEIEISMGMSSDFEQAITLGSTMVRVGRAIFGSR